MKNTKTGAAPEKAEELRHISTDTPGVVAKYDEPKFVPPQRGPQTGAAAASDAGFVAIHGTAEEFAKWRKEIEARRAKDTSTWIFMRCDNPRCGLVTRTKPTIAEGTPCVSCNWQRRTDLGHLKRMTDAEVNTYLFEKAQKDKEFDERARRAAWAGRNEELKKAGRPELSYEDFCAMRAREYQQQRANDRELGEMAAKARTEVLK